MKLRQPRCGPGKVHVQMTPMIDIVFQLLIFFVMTFQIVPLERDFHVRMPLAAAPGDAQEPVPPIKVRLTSDANGKLAGLYVGDVQLPNFERLHLALLDIVGTDRGPGSLAENAEVEIEADHQLHYENVIQAITAITGRVDPKSGQILKLIEKVKFSPPRPQ